MNYDRTFYGMDKLPSPQKICKHGDLSCQYTGKIMHPAEVDAYNRYTADFNRANDRSTQEFLLDQRFRFIHSIMRDNLEAKK